MSINSRVVKSFFGFVVAAGSLFVLSNEQVNANPAFARENQATCVMCHAGYPRLNAFGREFLENNIRMPDWKEKTGVPTGDDRLVLPKIPPVAFRVQMAAQVREAKAIDSSGAVIQDGHYDMQAPYLIKMMSGSPISDHMSYYFTAIMGEKGQNGQLTLDDAWVTYEDLAGTGIGVMAGQFQLADLMFSRETRLTMQDFIPYRMAGLTYERGIQFDRKLGPANIAIGATNGNGTSNNAALNSGGYKRPDRTLDNNNNKRFFGFAGSDIGPVNLGVFGSLGRSPNDTDEQIMGVNFSGTVAGDLFYFVQGLSVAWKDMPAVGSTGRWNAGFAGTDYVLNDRWTLSLLYSYGDAGDFDKTGNDYQGINLNSLTYTTTYYMMRNVKALLELTYDFQKADGIKDGKGHDTKEGYVLVGVDFAL